MYTVHKECREALGLSQAELARLAGVSQPLVSHAESGLGVKLLVAMHPALAQRAAAACTEQHHDPAALRALARLTEALDVDRKR